MGKHVGWLFFGSVSFVHTKEMNSSMKDEKHESIQEIKQKRKTNHAPAKKI